MCVFSSSVVSYCLCPNRQTVSCQDPLSMGFSRQEYWSGLTFPPQGDTPESGIEPMTLVSPTLQVGSLPLSHWGSSASVFPMNIQSWFPLGLTCLISLLFKGLSRVFSNTTVRKHQFFSAQPCLWSNPHIHTWLLKKPWLWWYGPLLTKFMSLLFNMLSRFVTSVFWGVSTF